MPYTQAHRTAPQTSRRLRPGTAPRVTLFTGEGSSHSWLWFADTFERMGFTRLRFCDVAGIAEGRLDGSDVLAVSGGDTIAVAAALGLPGSREIRRFVERGGLYLGSCAGAYLVMNSSKPHLNLFNFAGVKITNLRKKLPECRRMSHKFAMAYGCDYVFHPVRGPVRLAAAGSVPFPEGDTLEAPLYGGPGMLAAPEVEVLARYAAFTEKTVFLADPDLAHDTLVGTAAAVRARMGRGSLCLFGPHFEHPHFPSANRLLADVVARECGGGVLPAGRPTPGGRRRAPAGASVWVTDLRRELSNSRIVALGLEMAPVRWMIGHKVYEPEKIRVFLEAMWKRLPGLASARPERADPAAAERLVSRAKRSTGLLREIKRRLDDGADTLEPASALFSLLQRLTTDFLGLYFQTIREPR